MVGARASSPPAALAAGQARDDDAEEGDDGVDDGLACGGDGVNNGHDAVADCAEDGLDLGCVRECASDRAVDMWRDVRMIRRRPW